MTDGDRKILADNYWVLECESPFEICHADGSTATEQAAYMVLAYLYAQLQEEMEDEVNWKNKDN